MDAQFPSVAISLNHFRLSGNRLIVAMGNFSFPNKRLKVAPKLHSIRRINVDHLHLTSETFVLDETVHHEERVSEDEAIRPWRGMLVSLQDPIGDVEPGVPEQVQSLLRTVSA